MHILFVDESGTPPNPGKAYPRYFVVGGVIIPEGGWASVRDALLGMKARRGIRGELKWRYFAPTNVDERNPMRKLGQDDRDAIRAEVYRTICTIGSIKTIAAVCSVEAAYKVPGVTTQDDVYHLTYKVMTERFQYYLQDLSRALRRDEYGIIVGDHRGSRDDDKRLRGAHQKLLHSGAEFVSDYRNLIESLFLQPSNLSVGIQLADMIAGAVWRKFERNDERWFAHCESSFRRSKSGELAGYGIVKVPKKGWI